MNQKNSRVRLHGDHSAANTRVRRLEGIAYYLSGRAFMEILLGHQFENISMKQQGDNWDPLNLGGGRKRVGRRSERPETPANHDEAMRRILRDISGIVAERLSKTSHGRRCHGMYSQASFDAGFRAKSLGLSNDETLAFLDAQYRRCREILSLPSNWALVDRLAQELMRRREMSYSEVSDLFDEAATAVGNRPTLADKAPVPNQPGEDGLSRHGKDVLKALISVLDRNPPLFGIETTSKGAA